MRQARRGGFRRRRVRVTENRSRSRSSIVRRRQQPAIAKRGLRIQEREGAPSAAAPPTQLDESDGSGIASAACLGPEDRRLLRRLRRALVVLGDPPQQHTVRAAIHAFLDWALAYRRARASRPEGDGGSDSRSE